MVVVGLHPNCDIQALQKQYFGRKSEGSGKFRSGLSGQHQSRIEPNLEPQVWFVYPPEKPLPLKYKDLLSFYFPGGVKEMKAEGVEEDRLQLLQDVRLKLFQEGSGQNSDIGIA
ncbi:hypothetical protein F0562_030529 [Nyssa sinensis]|uniref:Uncharacterized protein n=1 Tax=Nyssa sinensis TaxID=561372 RepID=A0A5J5B020_9ASTE|nr:hypothetical protein F0562_030529 [Nyssa sinensis]